MKSVTIDKGAIKFVVNRADFMRCGITKIDSSPTKGDVVRIKDELCDQISKRSGNIPP